MAVPRHAGEVARYYDENTAPFLARGQGGSEGILHRAVWGEGVVDRAGAIHFVHHLILREIETLGCGRPRILDLGCGVGASLLYLLDRREAEGFGMTVSGEQYERARKRGNAAWLRGDFCRDALPFAIDLAYGIESLVDDFLAEGVLDQTPVRDFAWGWHAASLLPTRDVDRIAAASALALVSDRNLTPHLALDRPRDRALSLFLPLLRRFLSDSPRARSLVGGNALRACLKRGLVDYRFRVWEKRAVS